MTHMRFEPSGMTKNKQLPIAKSVVDYIFRWLASRFLPPEQQEAIGVQQIKSSQEVIEELSRPKADAESISGQADGEEMKFDIFSDAPDCYVCGELMERRGTCYTCPTCGATSGCS